MLTIFVIKVNGGKYFKKYPTRFTSSILHARKFMTLRGARKAKTNLRERLTYSLTVHPAIAFARLTIEKVEVDFK